MKRGLMKCVIKITEANMNTTKLFSKNDKKFIYVGNKVWKFPIAIFICSEYLL